MKIAFPAQDVAIQTPQQTIDPVWYDKLRALAQFVTNCVLGDGKLANNATSGFAWFPTVAGAPTGVPAVPRGTPSNITLAQCGFVPCVFDTTNNKIWIYTNGAWKGVVVA